MPRLMTLEEGAGCSCPADGVRLQAVTWSRAGRLAASTMTTADDEGLMTGRFIAQVGDLHGRRHCAGCVPTGTGVGRLPATAIHWKLSMSTVES